MAATVANNLAAQLSWLKQSRANIPSSEDLPGDLPVAQLKDATLKPTSLQDPARQDTGRFSEDKACYDAKSMAELDDRDVRNERTVLPTVQLHGAHSQTPPEIPRSEPVYSLRQNLQAKAAISEENLEVIMLDDDDDDDDNEDDPFMKATAAPQHRPASEDNIRTGILTKPDIPDSAISMSKDNSNTSQTNHLSELSSESHTSSADESRPQADLGPDGLAAHTAQGASIISYDSNTSFQLPHDIKTSRSIISAQKELIVLLKQQSYFLKQQLLKSQPGELSSSIDERLTLLDRSISDYTDRLRDLFESSNILSSEDDLLVATPPRQRAFDNSGASSDPMDITSDDDLIYKGHSQNENHLVNDIRSSPIEVRRQPNSKVDSPLHRESSPDDIEASYFESGEEIVASSDFRGSENTLVSRGNQVLASTTTPSSSRKTNFQISLSDFSDSDDEILSIESTSVTKKNNESSSVDDNFVTPSRPRITSHVNPSPQGVFSQIDFSSVEVADKYPWTSELFSTLKSVFHLNAFRGNQLRAINALLSKKDVLVLMPTGGGKSLCYQLPAVTPSGAGLTIVVSPLISLMQDQIAHLRDKNISAVSISAKTSASERNAIFQDMHSGSLQLLYVSPEMLQASQRMENELNKLWNNGQLTRIVIDEAHCVSSWGHDFRPDYKSLENMKNKYKDVPIMALTATANERVKLDILRCLRPERTIMLQQSFNRPNLYYEVLKKGGKGDAIEQAMAYIGRFPGKSGIIYCYSKVACEQTADSLSQRGVSAAFYHAGLTAEDRHHVQEKWQSGAIKVICATIAFGMGIDKADVRYVIHLSLPKTMEGYYQETGRAGRDGQPSMCLLLYSYRDASTISKIIDKDEGITDKEHQKQLLKRVVQYCENGTDCRRKQVLQYFNEQFDVSQCNKTCDNCKHSSMRTLISKDVSNIAKDIIELVDYVQHDNVTILHCVDIYRGLRNKRIVQSGHTDSPMYGKGKGQDRLEVDRIFHHLVAEGILKEYSHYNRAGFAQSYIKKGPKAVEVVRGDLKVTMNTFLEKESSVLEGSTVGGNFSKPKASTNLPVKTASVLKKRSANINVPKDDNYEMRYAELELVREEAKEAGNYSSADDICSDTSLNLIAQELPDNLTDFKKIKGLTNTQVLRMYKFFRPVIIKLRNQYQISSQAIDIADSQDGSASSYPSKKVRKTSNWSSSRTSSSRRTASRGSTRGNSRGSSTRGAKSASTNRGIRTMPI